MMPVIYASLGTYVAEIRIEKISLTRLFPTPQLGYLEPPYVAIDTKPAYCA